MPRRRQEVRKGFRAGEACGPLVSLPAAASCCPQSGRQAGVRFPGVVLDLRGRGGRRGPSSPKVGWLAGVWTPQSGEEEVAPGVLVAFCRPFPSETTVLISPRAWPALELGDFGKRPAGGTGGAGLHPPAPPGLHAPRVLSLCLAPGRGAASAAAAGSLACVPGRALRPPVPQSPCFVLLAAVLQQWGAGEKRGVQSEAATTPGLEGGEA